jgi:rare lipoprotein A
VRVTVLADESRAVAAALLAMPSTGSTAGISTDGSPAPVAAPRLAVQREGRAVVQPAVQRTGFDIMAALPGTIAPDGRFLPAPVVTEAGPVAGPKPRSIYVQAGAFSVFDSANRLQARLSSIAPAKIEATRAGGVQTFRVRLGPLETVERADAILARVTESGVSGAHIIVD